MQSIRAIKKNIYGKHHSILVLYPPGFAEQAFQEIEQIIDTPWHPALPKASIVMGEKEIHVHNISIYSIFEIFARANTIYDVQIILEKENISSLQQLAEKLKLLKYELFFPEGSSCFCKVASSQNSENKKIAYNYLKDSICNRGYTISQEYNPVKDFLIHLYLYRNKFIISTSLSGELLYKRGFRSISSNSAPLREDIAYSCIRKFFLFAESFQVEFEPKQLYVPFCGTGTLLFEFLFYLYGLSSIALKRDYKLKDFLFYKKETFDFCLKKQVKLAQEKSSSSKVELVMLDFNDKAIEASQENVNRFYELLQSNSLNIEKPVVHQKDFLKTNIEELFSENDKDVMILMNPPYGSRFGKSEKGIHGLYAGIAEKLNQFSKNTNRRIGGFILCPDEVSWKYFLKNLKGYTVETYHFMQGGKDIRCCNFIL